MSFLACPGNCSRAAFIILFLETLLILLRTPSTASATPVPEVHISADKDVPLLRHVKSIGLEGTLTLLERLRDAIGTATQAWGFGPSLMHSVHHSLEHGPLRVVYRNAISAELGALKGAGRLKELMTRGFGTVGVVRYSFKSNRMNVAGESTQVMTACRCTGHDCTEAILLRPVNITETGPDGRIRLTGRKSCIYQFYKGTFTDCHSETIKTQDKRKGQSRHHSDYWVFEVNASQHGEGSWKALGFRGWDYACHEDDFKLLPRVNVSGIGMANISSEIEDYPLRKDEGPVPMDSRSGCRPPPGVQYFRDEREEDGAQCAETYEFSIAAGSFRASQMDQVAIGMKADSYTSELPALLRFWEVLVLSCAASLGLYFAHASLTKYRKKGFWSRLRTVKLVAVILMSVAFEALPLHFALGFEADAKKWAGRFAYLAATIAVGKDQVQVQESAYGNIVVLTALLGESQYIETQLVTVVAFTAVVDIGGVVILLAVVFVHCRARASRGKMGEDEHDGEEEDMQDEMDDELDSDCSQSYDSEGRAVGIKKMKNARL